MNAIMSDEDWELQRMREEQAQRERFEKACYAHYLQRHADGKTADRHTVAMQPHQLLWRQPDGEYGVLMFNVAWWAWKAGQEE